jgi:tetraacyldisaccharide 4'-kinase
MEQRLTKLWYRDTAGPSLLQPLSWLYGAIVRVRRAAYCHGWLVSHRAGKPVIVVGNLTVGGTGKTPLVIWLARHLTERGLKVGIVSRGYGSNSAHEPRFVDAGHSTWEEVGDEPVLLSRATGCDTVVGRDRVAAAKTLIARGVDVIVADDGLQHLPLARDCEIVVIDGARGFGNARVLPAGPLREPVSRLANANLIVINGTAEHPSLRHLQSVASAKILQMTLQPAEAVRINARRPSAQSAPDAPRPHEAQRASDPPRASDAQRPSDAQDSSRPLDTFRDRPLHAVAGIGNPARFFRDLRARGLEVIEHPFPDHHPFTPRDLSFADDLPVLMTEKDAVKCGSFSDPRLWFVPTAAHFGDAQARELLEHVLCKIAPDDTDGG